jgi:hypothetical protein
LPVLNESGIKEALVWTAMQAAILFGPYDRVDTGTHMSMATRGAIWSFEKNFQ